ncbi:MAG TPA: hypothetical protein PK593_03355 [Thermomicrobiales bacterium]|jgi:hypothetical protein|nr:hypothetical protein [Chloroflexota bacterium]HQX62479.1 hypothetical protein [Thermomicrobiales bacterium]HBY45068.1 hypothetical protein [Chloroflexota bacterium]HCG29862.1 hypothetical protein [Chloroflexota bacterium]HQZ90176.1 hypothetical protein [Thermomicrobiales bacterium]
MPRHILTILAVTVVFFILIWLGVVEFGQTPGKALLLSFGTLFLLGIGITYSASTLRKDHTGRD